MRPRKLVLASVLGGLLGAMVGLGLTLTRPQCFQVAICKVDLSRGGGCLPGPCDTANALPAAFWAGAGVGVLLGLVMAVAFEVRRRPNERKAL